MLSPYTWATWVMSLAVRKLPLGHSSASFSLAATLNPSKPPNHLYLPCSRWVCPGREPFGSRQDLFSSSYRLSFPCLLVRCRREPSSHVRGGVHSFPSRQSPSLRVSRGVNLFLVMFPLLRASLSGSNRSFGHIIPRDLLFAVSIY